MFGLTPWREKENVGFPMPRLQNEFKALYDRFFSGWPVLFEPVTVPKHFWQLDVNEMEKEIEKRKGVRLGFIWEVAGPMLLLGIGEADVMRCCVVEHTCPSPAQKNLT